MKPVISLFSSAVRPDLWMRLYKSLKKNDVPFEVIFVGDNPPKFKLPENCHFIYSETKPVQCVEIAARYATSEYIMPFADDCVFSPHALDNLLRAFKELNDEKIILSCRYVLFGKDIAEESARYWVREPNSPIMPAAGLMTKKMWKELGGIDRSFMSMFWDLDLAMRMYEIGGRVLLSKDAWIEEFHPWNKIIKKRPKIMQNKFIHKTASLCYQSVFRKGKKKTRLFMEHGLTTDRQLLDSFWVPKDPGFSGPVHCLNNAPELGILSKKRLKPFFPFEEKHLLTITQGPKGRWR